MKISRIRVFRVDLPIVGGHRISGGRHFDTLDDTVVIVDTDGGISGIGENCPLGTGYVPAFAEGTRAGLSLLAPKLIGEDPLQIAKINQIMDGILLGHPYVKTPIDMACWDILGKFSRLPLCDLLGGRLTEDLPFRVPVPIDDKPEVILQTIEQRRKEGFFSFNIKVGNEPYEDLARLKAVASQIKPHERLFADANRGWRLDQALVVLRALPLEYRVYFEQPCPSFAECATLRRLTSHLIILDELADTTEAMLRAWQEGAAEGFNLKISRVGGISKLKLMRDICIELGIPLLVQDSWASAIGSAAVAHLAHSTPSHLMLGVWGAGFNVHLETAKGGPVLERGCLRASRKPGLGLEPQPDVLGKPVAVYE